MDRLICFIGPPGSGKGTQARILINTLYSNDKKAFFLETGVLLKNDIRDDKISNEFFDYMKLGKLVPDDIVNDWMSVYLLNYISKSGILILDGFPRTLGQAIFLDIFLKKYDKKVDAVINFDIKREAVINRLAKRLLCENCSKTFILEELTDLNFKCNNCGSNRINKRNDDSNIAINRRFDDYCVTKDLLINHYKHYILDIDANNSVQSIANKIFRYIDSF
ncbi:MAG: nucleoside monophosphate kinase [Anaplasmataceae bacterium]|nr:nucleoside monophosphate kinase [Anaplasmataceae bacterium]